MRTLSDEERERKRQERNREKRERRARYRQIDAFLQGDVDLGHGTALEAAVAKIAEDVPGRGGDNGHSQRLVVRIGEVDRELPDRAHRMLEPLLKLAKARNRNGMGHNILLVGPAGCGKSHAVQQVAQALELDYGFISLSAGISESHLIGRYIPSGENGRFEYQEAPFVTFYRDGGVFCLDELDAADENVLLVVNGGLANGHLRLPDGTAVARHPDFVCIGCANTFGNGADRQYVGRNQLDGATLDRFVSARLEFDYDLDLERAASREDVCTWAQGLRDKVTNLQYRRVISTRFIFDASDLVDSGAYTLREAKRSLLLDWSKAELDAVGEAV
jgi:hypothetical protein